MKLIKELYPKDIGVDTIEINPSYKIRKASRAIVVNEENNIAILSVRKDSYHKLPGGGLEGNEDIEEALRREVKEEVGTAIEIDKEIGCIIEYRDKINQLQISYCYRAKAVGNLGKVDFTEEEINNGFELKWYSIEEAIKIMEKDQPKGYVGKFINKRDLIFLKEAVE